MAALDRVGELKTIRTEVDPVLEITEITDRVSKNAWGQQKATLQMGKVGVPNPGGPALLFQNVKGHPGSQVLINQLGSARRMNLALKVDSLDHVTDRIRALMDVMFQQVFLHKVINLLMLADMVKLILITF